MKTHELKTDHAPFWEICEGRKRFEFRKDDRGFAVNDFLALCDSGIPEGYAILSLADVLREVSR